LYKSLPNYILLYHNYEQGAKLKKGKQKLLKRWADHARLNAAACQQVFYELKKTNGINIEKAEVFTNPLSFNPPQKPTPYPSVQNSIVIWVMLAALDVNRKAQDVLINTLSADKWKLRNWELHLYGTGKDHEHIEELIKYNGLDSKIMLKGHTNDSLSVLQSAHWLFQCTHKDAMPLSVMEAMATGRPCFVSNTGDMALWIKDGFNGLVCETATNKNIDLKLDELWNKQQLWAEMGLNAFETFQKKFTSPYEKTLLNWLESYC
jgi:glycosyltransferase involved in cell wall biosynthesis